MDNKTMVVQHDAISGAFIGLATSFYSMVIRLAVEAVKVGVQSINLDDEAVNIVLSESTS